MVDQTPIVAAAVAVIALVVVLAGWLLILANGKRPLAVRIRWLGLDVAIATADSNSCSVEPSQSQEKQ